ncbi:N-acetylmuramoyl-L-alanine amidase [Oceanibaculum pacificum]|uniref:N-acetylmuramoyl-L-alanine amidase n=1 Tax=Oceanibaculum pacificum TaxID=580166 RepID=A0A154VAN6_9PROT|nr:N-acetylmuramoyl-L-alanine amidase [Oceanibaculum pacificum]KZC98329.1 N-acetylmuramoyl-L-alanine amidase [Oceanibaculum pacificum]
MFYRPAPSHSREKPIAARVAGRWRTLAPALLFCLALLHSLAAIAAPAVTGMRIGNYPDKTRIVFDISEEVRFQTLLLPDPYRVVIDLPELDWRLPEEAFSNKTGMVQGLRYGLFQPGVSRVVMDIGQPMQVQEAFLLPPGEVAHHRLVIDLAPTSREKFLTASKASMSSKRAFAPNPPPVPGPAPFAEQLRRPDGKRVVVIDAGHGGVDPGAIGVSGIYEKELTLAMAKQLQTTLQRTGKYHVVLTRDRDIFLRLRERIGIARREGAELFVSLHADAIKDKGLRGLSVYSLSETASDSEAEALAQKENKADLIAGIDLSSESPEVTNILINLAQRETMNDSARFAAMLLKELDAVTPLLRRSHRFAGFAVLKAPDVPSVLVEMGFLSNATDEANLRNRAYREKMAKALQKGIDAFFAFKDSVSRS